MIDLQIDDITFAPYLDTFMGSFCLYKEGLYYTLTPIPKQEDFEYIRKIIWEIFDHLDYSQYIEKLIWDNSEAFFPAIAFGKAPKELWSNFHNLRNSLVAILAKKWNKEWKV